MRVSMAPRPIAFFLLLRMDMAVYLHKLVQTGCAALLEWRKANDATFKSFVDLGYKQCVGCGTFVEKIAGCKHMTCSLCVTHFCYVCGEELGHPGLSTHAKELSDAVLAHYNSDHVLFSDADVLADTS